MPPQLYDFTGKALNPLSEDAVEGVYNSDGTGRQYGVGGSPPMAFNNAKGGTRKVGWTLVQPGQDPVAFSFNLNPQSIQRVDSSRTQIFATKGGFYVDSFGAGPTQITVTQYVASGQTVTDSAGMPARATMRQAVLDFYDGLYLPAIQASYSSQPIKVYFYDDHLYDTTFSRVPELVYFPQQSWQLSRSVSQNNVWLLTLTMTTLENQNSSKAQVNAAGTGTKASKVPYVVQAGQTLKTLAVALAGPNATDKRITAIETKIIAANKGTPYGIDKKRQVPVFGTSSSTQSTGTVTAHRLELVPGEKLWLPASS